MHLQSHLFILTYLPILLNSAEIFVDSGGSEPIAEGFGIGKLGVEPKICSLRFFSLERIDRLNYINNVTVSDEPIIDLRFVPALISGLFKESVSAKS
jgi:hypothetical protein